MAEDEQVLCFLSIVELREKRASEFLEHAPRVQRAVGPEPIGKARDLTQRLPVDPIQVRPSR